MRTARIAISLSAVLLMCVSLHAQTNITRIEYYLDSDPGFGNGTSISFTPSTNVNINATLDMSSVSDGFHWFYIRGKDAGNKWSVSSYRLFYKGIITSTAPTQPNVTRVEYFFDSDPGLGKGTPVSITPSSSVNVSQVFDIGTLSNGFHWIYIRGMDANGKWSVASYRLFYKGVLTTVAPTQANITKVEYFFDTDPGLGKGIPVTITQGNSVNINQLFDVSHLSEGFHWIYLRGMEANGRWSVASYRMFYKGTLSSTAPTQPNLVKVEYFFNTDPGLGKGIPVTVTPGTSINVTTNVDVSALPDGFNKFYIRGMDATGKWNIMSWRYFYKGQYAPAPENSTIKRIEYFIDTDPGYDRATSLPFTPGAVEDTVTAVIDLGSLAEGSHKFAVRIKDSMNRWGYLTARNFVLDKTPPAAPAGLGIVIGNSQVTLSWSQNSEADFLRYRIYKGTTSGSEVLYDSVAGKTNVSRVVSGLTNDVNYFFYLTALDSALLESGPSNAVSGTPLASAGPPPAPVILSASDLNQYSFKANWSPSPSAAAYNIDVSTNINFTSYVTGYNNMDVGDVTSYNVTGLSLNTTYYYRVRARSTYGISLNSGTMSVTTLLNPPAQPSAPSAISATLVSQTGFTANWNSAATATGYYLDVASDNTFTAMLTGYDNKDMGNSLNAPVTGLTKNTAYYYRVRAYNTYGTSSNSNTITVTTWPDPPAAPVALPASNTGSSSFSANWNSVETATGYRIDVATDIGFTAILTGYNNKDVSNALTTSVTGLTVNVTYYYRVRAYNNGGTGPNSNIITVLVNPDVPQPPVAQAASNITQTSFTAVWNSSAGANGYKLDIATDQSFTAFLTGLNDKDVSNVTSFSVTGLTAGTSYYYRVRAYNNGGTSPGSNVITAVTLPDPPAAPVALQPTGLSHTYFTAQWNSVSTATGYILDVATDGSFTAFVSGFTNKDVSNTLSFTVTGLTDNVTYYYRIRAYNTGGQGSYSNTITITTPVALPPPPDPPVSGSPGNTTQTAFVATWSASTGALGYRIDVSTNIGFTSTVTGYNNKDVGNVTTTSISGLNANTTYYYRIRAYNTGGTSNNSAVVSVTTLPYPPSSPAGFTGQSCEFLVTLKWKSNKESDFLRYRIYGGTTSNPTVKIDSTSASRNDTIKIYKGLVKGQTYYYRITAVSITGLESEYSNQATVKVIKGVTPKIHVKWNDVLICYNHGDSLSSFQWYKGTNMIQGATGQYYASKKQPGPYSVITQDMFGCRDTSNVIQISGLKALNIFPNPAISGTTLSLKCEDTGPVLIRIITQTGVKIAEIREEKTGFEYLREMTLDNIPKGIYTVEALINKEVYYSKLVVVR